MKIENPKATFYKNTNDEDKVFMRLEFDRINNYDDRNSIDRITFPKISLNNIAIDRDIPDISCGESTIFNHNVKEVLVLQLHMDDNNEIYNIKTKRRSMTLNNIEKELGYEVNLVD